MIILNQQKILDMYKEIGVDITNQKILFSEFDNWTNMLQSPSVIKTQIFIEITTTTVPEINQGGKYGELGADPERN